MNARSTPQTLNPKEYRYIHTHTRVWVVDHEMMGNDDRDEWRDDASLIVIPAAIRGTDTRSVRCRDDGEEDGGD